MNWKLLANSLGLSVLASVLAVGAGFVVALTLASSGPKWRRAILVGAIVTLALPPFLVTNCWLELLGYQSALRRWLPLNLYSVPGAASLLALLTWPITTLLAAGAWSRLESPQLEADPALRNTMLLRWLLWPMARVAVRQAALLTFVLVLNNFSVPVILQVPVFPEELWLAFTARLNDAGAAAAAWPMVLVPLIGLVLLRRSDIAWPRTRGTVDAIVLRRQMGPRIVAVCVMLTAGLFGLSLGVPLVQLAASARTWIELPIFLRASPDVVLNSFVCAASTATVCVALGLALRRLPLGVASWLPFLIPGVLIGRAAIFAFNETILYPTVALVILVFSLRYFGIAWSGVSVALKSMDRDPIDAAKLGGARGWVLFRHILWPQMAAPVAGVWYVAYLVSLWDVETLVLIQPPGGETLALRIFNMLHYGHNAQVNATCVALLAVAVMPLALWKTGGWLLGRRR